MRLRYPSIRQRHRCKDRPTTITDPLGLAPFPPGTFAGLDLWIYYTVAQFVADETNRDVEIAPFIGGDGNSMDAMRHCEGQCRLETEAGPRFADILPFAHEVQNTFEGQSFAELKWDWWNYRLGSECARQGAGNPGGPTCFAACFEKVKAGRAAGRKGIPQRFRPWP